MLSKIQTHILSIKNALKNIFLVSISTLLHVGQDLFLNFFSTSYGFVTPTQNKLLKWGAKDASRGAKDASGDGNFKKKFQIKFQEIFKNFQKKI